MRVSRPSRPLLSTLLAVALLSSKSLYADAYKRIERHIDASSLSSIEIEAAVAEMEIEFHDGDMIELVIELEAERSWLSWRRGNVEDIELQEHQSDTNQYFGILDKKVQQQWRLTLPASLAVAIEVGVGDIELKGVSNNLEMDVGVGSVRVDIDDTDYGMIRASAGVGDSSIQGFGYERVDNERSFVSSDSFYNGDGELEMRIDVGVGDVEVRSR